MTIVHLCCGGYEHGLFGGVPRFDFQVKAAFPDRILVKYPEQLERLPTILRGKSDVILICDTHAALAVPNHYRVIAVHHGVAPEHVERVPQRRDLVQMAELQKKVWSVRDPSTTLVVSTSEFCTHFFRKHGGDLYDRFPLVLIPLASEHGTVITWQPRPSTDSIVVLGNFATPSKGLARVPGLERAARELSQVPMEFRNFNVKYRGGPIDRFHEDKQHAYGECDVFLQLSSHEGTPYATLDAMHMGVPVVATDVGIFWGDEVPLGACVKVPWQADDASVIAAILEAHARRTELSVGGREFIAANRQFTAWKDKMKDAVARFDAHVAAEK